MEDRKKLRGFAAMTPALRSEIAAKGGRATPGDKRAFATNPALAKSAGAKGGAASRRPKGP